ncbi:hypothetical protein Cgig2_017640 [Carnegiea gigantea]|uniref:Uncharacterized protein n=1 Tax=Carnegiea gigantea TaxID=171969 RepID=A0A9Q1KBW9_9CARY|nr:hypothetical protein Cgig2_017640 [Carnegiea gigantea]
MDVDGTVVADSGRGRELVVYVLWGELEEGQDGKVTHVGGSRKYFVVKEGMRVEEVQRMATEIIGSDLSEQKIWYSLKYDSQILVAVEGDMDVRIVFKIFVASDEVGDEETTERGGDEGTKRKREVRNLVRTEQNDHQFIQQQDQAMDFKTKVDLDKWKQGLSPRKKNSREERIFLTQTYPKNNSDFNFGNVHTPKIKKPNHQQRKQKSRYENSRAI